MGRNLLTFAWLLICISQLYRSVDAKIEYINVTCVEENGNYKEGSVYQQNLDTLLSDLSSHGLIQPFYNCTAGEAPNKVYALYQCRGDVTQEVCAACIQDAVEKVVQGCPLFTEGSVWYYECMLRYANRSFFSLAETYPSRHSWYRRNVSNYAAFTPVLARTLNSVINEAARNSSRGYFATKAANYTLSGKVYCLAQCIPLLDEFDCRNCLTAAKSNMVNVYNTSVAVAIFTSSCQLIYDTTHQFYREISSDPPSPSNISLPGETPKNPETDSGMKPSIIAGIVAGAFGGVIMLAAGAWFYLRRQAPPPKQPLPQPTPPLPAVQPSTPRPKPFKDLDDDFVEYDFATLKAATNDFSTDQKLGQGGFGIVYLGTLYSGQKVAVKKLSAGNMTQGAEEFMAEAHIVAKLQHKNLVKLLGSCSKGNEKLLVFEFLPNKSLDHFLLDPTKRSILHWNNRYHIITEVARGIQYLHVDSRIKIIHRDLKPSNILLDMDMNPKIADFGMARLFERGQMLGNTNQIIGTRGYMAPEYWRGEYSEKSDVYSFGIIILELVSGQDNRALCHSSPRDDLPSQAWRLWEMDQSLQLMDHTLHSSYSANEVIRCIHIGLLCVQQYAEHRPTMVQVVQMLTSSTPLPPPTAPTMSPHHFNAPAYSSDEGGQSEPFAAMAASRMDIAKDFYPR